MDTNEEVIVDDNEEEVVETDTGEETAGEAKVEKQKRTPEEELAYFEGRARRLRKDLGLDDSPKQDKPAKKAAQKSDELDYGAKAYLAANGIKGAKEFDFVQSELKKSGDNLDALLENDYFKTRLENFRALNKTAEATPTGRRATGVATDSVEYWMTKPFEEVPKDMRNKVIQAKLDKENSKGGFYNS